MVDMPIKAMMIIPDLLAVDTDNRYPLKICMCAYRCCSGGSGEGMIKEYYSVQQAKDDGWVFTFDKRFCKPESNRCAWVCSECVKKLGLKLRGNDANQPDSKS